MRDVSLLSESILGVVTSVPSSQEPVAACPDERVAALVHAAALRTAQISGVLALAPAPLGLLTLLPDLVAVWRVQSQLVSDVAAAYGKSAELTKESLLWCLFKHSAAQVVKDMVYRAGERYLIRPVSLQLLQNLATRVGVHLAKKAMGRTVARFVPFAGAVGVAGYAYYDTQKVGKTAQALFQKTVVVE